MIRKEISRLTLLPSRSRNLCDYTAISNETLRGFFACLDLVAAGSKYRCSVRVGNRGKRLQNGCIATHVSCSYLQTRLTIAKLSLYETKTSTLIWGVVLRSMYISFSRTKSPSLRILLVFLDLLHSLLLLLAVLSLLLSIPSPLALLLPMVVDLEEEDEEASRSNNNESKPAEEGDGSS